MAVNDLQMPVNSLATENASLPKRRTSCLKELNVDSEGDDIAQAIGTQKRPRCVHFRSRSDVFIAPSFDRFDCAEDEPPMSFTKTPDYTVSLKTCPEPTPGRRKQLTYPRHSTMPHMLPWTLVIALIFAILHNFPSFATAGPTEIGMKRRDSTKRDNIGHINTLEGRADSPTDVCTRWSQQTAVVNGTVYIYGGRATTQAGQTQNEWNNDFLTLDVTKSWAITSPTLTGLEQPSGPPAVANGWLWHSYTSLFLYGGEYSDAPAVSPSPFALWEYDIPSSTWTEHTSPSTVAGTNSAPGNIPVQNAAEGAGFSVPALGMGWYFGGHLDEFTTAGWSNQIARVYLKSMIEFTYPGYSNNAIPSLSNNEAAGIGGAWRNITEGGLQNTDGFPERADGVLVYVPGYGKQGILLGLAGGTNATFTSMNIIDVYDIANSTWYTQATQGGPPEIRVNPCAIAVSAADGSSTNVYMYGGQNLLPYGEQTQYGDMWILTIPSFTWIQVDDSDGAPPPRAGHSCEVWDGQIIIIGGYVGPNISCDPGFYVFDASNLKWQTQFNALSGGNDQSKQTAQEGNELALAGSYGYSVPAVVQSVIGGNAQGGATVTAPESPATAGPIATGGPIVYTITASGSIITETAGAQNVGTSGSASNGTNVAAIVAGVVAGIFFCLAGYLGFCALLYRRQLKLYKAHVAAAQRAALVPPNEKTSFLSAQQSSEPTSSHGPKSVAGSSSNPSNIGGPSQGEVPPLSTSAQLLRTNSDAGSDDLIEVQEPSFFGILLRPRRSLRVVNRD